MTISPDLPPRTWPQNVQPSPAQLWDWLTQCTPEQREDVLRRLQEHADISATCFQMNHKGAMAELQMRLQQVALLERKNRRLKLAWASARRFRRTTRVAMDALTEWIDTHETMGPC